MTEREFMAWAVNLAGQGRGATAPNPCVGAVLVREGRVVAEGWHQRFGGPHAEVNCLGDALAKGQDPAQATLYVTLEPCSHHGKTPPCTEAILAAKIKKVVIGCLDPNPHVSGLGAEILAQAGVEVRVGVLARDCQDLIADFLVWQFSSRAFNTLKMASTLDGRIATRTGHPAWISGEESRELVHQMRSRVGAVVVGAGTLRQDNPKLTARPKESRPVGQPLAVVVGSLPQAKDELYLLRSDPRRAVFWTSQEQAGTNQAQALRDLGCRVLALPSLGQGLDLAEGFIWLRRELGVLATLCEGGGRLALSLLEQNLADEFVLFLAPKVLGDAMGAPMFSGRQVQSMDQALDLRLVGQKHTGQDLCLTYRPLGAEIYPWAGAKEE